VLDWLLACPEKVSSFRSNPKRPTRCNNQTVVLGLDPSTSIWALRACVLGSSQVKPEDDKQRRDDRIGQEIVRRA